MAEQKKEESFKVIDRRLFTPEGDLREEVVEQERREQEAATSGQTPLAGRQDAAGKAASGGPGAAPDSARASAAAESPAPSHNFQMLVDFVARNAAVLLGGYADPQTGQAILDLEGAREFIDMLDVLREKTCGNLAPEDDRLLIEVLGSLKFSYLQMSKAAAKAMQEKPKS